MHDQLNQPNECWPRKRRGVPLTNCNFMGQTCSSKVLEFFKTVNTHALVNTSTSESLLPECSGDLNETFLAECDLSTEVGTGELMAHHLQSDASDIKDNSVWCKVLSF